jgi:hypothetical protein
MGSYSLGYLPVSFLDLVHSVVVHLEPQEKQLDMVELLSLNDCDVQMSIYLWLNRENAASLKT